MNQMGIAGARFFCRPAVRAVVTKPTASKHCKNLQIVLQSGFEIVRVIVMASPPGRGHCDDVV